MQTLEIFLKLSSCCKTTTKYKTILDNIKQEIKRELLNKPLWFWLFLTHPGLQVSSEVAKASTAKEEEEKILLLVTFPPSSSLPWRSLFRLLPLLSFCWDQLSSQTSSYSNCLVVVHILVSILSLFPNLPFMFLKCQSSLAAVELSRDRWCGADGPAGEWELLKQGRLGTLCCSNKDV